MSCIGFVYLLIRFYFVGVKMGQGPHIKTSIFILTKHSSDKLGSNKFCEKKIISIFERAGQKQERRFSVRLVSLKVKVILGSNVKLTFEQKKLKRTDPEGKN